MRDDPREAATGFACRTAIADHHAVTRDVLPNAKLPYDLQPLIYFERDNVTHQQFRSGVEALGLKNVDDHYLNKMDEPLGMHEPTRAERHTLYRLTHVAICPACLRDKPVILPLVRYVKWAAACLKHQCYLITACPKCNAKLSERKVLDGQCSCGHLFARSPVTSVPSKILESQQTVQQLLIGEQNGVAIEDAANCSTVDYFRQLYVVGRLIHGFPSTHPFVHTCGVKVETLQFLTSCSFDTQQIAALVHVAHEVVVHPSVGFPQILPYVLELARTRFPQKRSVLKQLLSFDNCIYKSLYDECAPVSGNLFTRGRRKRNNALTFSVAETIAKLSTSHAKVMDLIKQGVLTRRGEGIDKVSVDAFLRTRERFADMKQAEEILGLDHQQIRNLVAHDALPAKRTEGRWEFDALVLQEWLFPLMVRVSTVTVMNGDWISLASALKKFRRRKLNLVRILSELRENNLRACTFDLESGINGLFFKGLEISDLLKEEKRWNKSTAQKAFAS